MKKTWCFVLTNLLGLLLATNARAADDVDLQKVIAIQQAEIQQLKAKAEEFQAALDKFKGDVDKSNGTFSQQLSSTTQMAKTAYDRPEPIVSFWKKSGAYTSCNQRCASASARCIAGSYKEIQVGEAVPCTQATNICYCIATITTVE